MMYGFQKSVAVPGALPAWLSELRVRLLVAEDLPALEWDGEYAHFRRLYRETYQSACSGKSLMWVAELPEAGLVGQLFVQLVSARSELADGVNRAYLYAFRVKPHYRSQGVGGYVLQTVETDLVQRKFSWVSLNVARDNRDARRFYERHGYKIFAADPGRWFYLDDQDQRHDVHEPAWRMRKRLRS
jgi:ribosomal protein S18 acetylase RimI-like enzyme